MLRSKKKYFMKKLFLISADLEYVSLVKTTFLYAPRFHLQFILLVSYTLFMTFIKGQDLNFIAIPPLNQLNLPLPLSFDTFILPVLRDINEKRMGGFSTPLLINI